MKPELSIMIPQDKTEQLIRLCVSEMTVRKYSRNPIQVIVVDNNSCDAWQDRLYKKGFLGETLIENKRDLRLRYTGHTG